MGTERGGQQHERGQTEGEPRCHVHQLGQVASHAGGGPWEIRVEKEPGALVIVRVALRDSSVRLWLVPGR